MNRIAYPNQRAHPGQVDERVVRRTGEDIAVGALDVAERAGIEPERLETAERHGRARLAGRRDMRIGKLRYRVRARDLTAVVHLCPALTFHCIIPK